MYCNIYKNNRRGRKRLKEVDKGKNFSTELSPLCYSIILTKFDKLFL